MQTVTTVTFFSFTTNKFWAFKQMGIAPLKLGNIKGLKFFKFLGTGGGSGFSLWPDFSTYAFMGVWEQEVDFNNFIEILDNLNIGYIFYDSGYKNFQICKKSKTLKKG